MIFPFWVSTLKFASQIFLLLAYVLLKIIFLIITLVTDSPPLSVTNLIHQRILPPYRRLNFLATLICLLSWGFCFMILIMSFPILLWSFKPIPYLLVGFWMLWIFNYPLSFTLVFPTIPSFPPWIDMRLGGFPPLVS